MANSIIGTKTGRLKVISYEGKNKWKIKLYRCLCDCGKEITIRSNQITGKRKTLSCGCIREEKLRKHGDCYTKFYGIWESIKLRCNNPKEPMYKYYGARGIIHDLKWKDYLKFKKDMYFKWIYAQKKYRKVLSKNNPLTIERKDVNGNYNKENCCFIPLNEQAKNTRNLKWFRALSPENKEYIHNNQSDFAKKYNLNNVQISSCLHKKNKTHRGWTFNYLTEEETNDRKK